MSELDSKIEFSETVFTRDRRAWWAGMDVPGVNVCTTERLTVPEAFDLYLPWEMQKVALGYQKATDVGGFTVETFEATDYFGLQRSDTGRVLGTGKDGFTFVSNADQSALLSEAINGANHAVASIGALAHGRTTFVSVDFDDMPTVNADGQEIQPFLAVVNGNDGSGSLKVYATGIRPECYNTIDMGWLAGQKFAALRHTSNIMDRLPDVKASIRRYLDLAPTVERTIRKLIETRVDAVSYRRALETLTPIPNAKEKDGKVTNQRAITIAENRRDKVLDLAYNDERVGYEGTLWGAFQTFSTFDQWERRIRKTDASGVTTIQQATLDRMFSGEQAKDDANRLDALIRVTGVTGVKVQKGVLALA